LELATDLKLLDQSKVPVLMEQSEEVARMINGLLGSLDA
jgi:hypothetical protein